MKRPNNHLNRATLLLTTAIILGLVAVGLPISEANLLSHQSIVPVIVPQAPPTGTYFDHLVFIIMENEGIGNICGNSVPPCNGTNSPYMSSLANNYTLAQQYLSINNTSQPNYVGILAATNQNCHSGCGPGTLTETNLVDRFTEAGLTWKGYMENQNVAAGCDNGEQEPYEYEHNPFVAFSDIDGNITRCNNIVVANPSSCPAGVNGYASDCQLINDLNSASPANFMWLTPNNCDNMHAASVCTADKCTTGESATCIEDGDDYLENLIPNILDSNTFKNTRAALFVTFDEGNGFCPLNGGSEDCMYAVWAGPEAKTGFTNTVLYNHYSFTKTIETNWGLATMTSNDAGATAMTAFFKTQAADFTISANPATLSTSPGTHANSTITLQSINSFTGTVTLTATSSPTGPTLTLNPTSVALGSGGTGTSTLTFTSSTTGNYNVTVKGTSGSLSHTTIITTSVAQPDFTITTNPSSLTLGQLSSTAGSPISVSPTGDGGFFQSSYLETSFYARGLYWLFYEDTGSTCEHQSGCLMYTSSTAGSTWATPTQVPVHVETNDFSVSTNGTYVFYARYNETSFESSCGRNIQFGLGSLSSSGTITWKPEQTVAVGASNRGYSNDEIIVDSNNQVWIAYMIDNHSSCGGSGIQRPEVIHSSGTNYASWTGNTTLSTAHSNIWHIALTSLGNGEVYASYWIGNSDVHGRLYNGSTWGSDEQISPTTTLDDANGWLFNNATNVYAIYYDNGTETYNLATRSSTGTWTGAIIGTSETHTGTKFSSSYYSLPDAAGYDSKDNLFDVFYMNSTAQKIDQWAGYGTSWTKTTGLVTTATVPYPDSITSFIQSSPAALGAIFYISGSSTYTIYSAVLAFTPSGNTGSFIVAITGKNGFTATVNLTTSISPSTGLTVTCSPTSITGGSGTSTCNLTGSSNGNYTVTVTGTSGSLSHQATVAVRVTGVDFTITASSPAPVNAGQSAASTITIAPVNNFTGTVNLTDTVPPGLACGSISPSSITKSGTATVSCSSTSALNYTLTITGTSGSLVHTSTATFRFQNFTLTANPTSVTVNAGSPATSTITIASQNGFAGIVSLTTNSTSCTLSPTSVTGSGASTLSCTFSSTAVYHVSVTGTSGSLTHLTTVTFTTQDFTIVTSPSAITIDAGVAGSSTITITSLQGFSGIVALTTNSTSCTVSPTSLTGSGSSTLSCTFASAGTIHVTVTGTSGSLSHSVTVTYTVQDFTITATPPSVNVNNNSAGTSSITIAPLDGFAAIVNLVTNSTSCTISPTSITGSGSATLTCTFNTTGNKHVQVTGSSSPLAHSVTVTFVVQDFTIGASPTAVNADVNATGTSTITITPVNGFAAVVDLTSNSTFCTLSPTSVTGSGSSTLSCTFTSTGTFQVNARGTSAGLSHPVIVTFVVQDFTISASPTSVSVNANAAGTSTIAIAAVNGFAGFVNLVTNTTSSCTVSPRSVTGSGSVILSCTFTSTSNKHVSVTGTSASLSHTVTVSFVVQDFTLAAIPSSVNVNVNATGTSSIAVTAVNGFTGIVGLITNSTSCTVSPPSLTGSGSATLSCTFTSASTIHVGVTGASASLSHSVTVAFVVQDFTTTASPTTVTVNVGAVGASTISVAALNGFAGVVSLTTNSTFCTVSPTTITDSGSSTLSCTFATVGTFHVSVTETSASLSHSVTVAYVVQDFTISANPVSVNVNVDTAGTSTVTISPVDGFAGVVNLATNSTSSCTTSPTSVTGSGTSTLSCSFDSTGNNHVLVTGTSGSLSHSITVTFVVHDYTIAASPSSVTVNVNTAGTSTINITAVNGFSGIVSLTTNSTFCSLSPTSVTGSGSSTLTCTFTSTGTDRVSVTGNSGSLSHSVTVSFVVQDFTVTASPTSVNVNVNSPGNSTITITPVNGFGGLVNLATNSTSCAVTPTGITGSGSATLSCTYPSARKLDVRVTGTSGSIVHSADILYTVQDYTLGASPSAVAVKAESSGNSTITVTGLQSFTGTVELTDTVSPSIRLSCTLSPASVVLGASGTSTLSCSGSAGSYNVTVTGTSGSLSHSANVTYTVQDFTITASPTSVTVDAGTAGNSNITVAALDGFSGVVSLATNSTSCTVSPASVTGSGASSLSCTFTSYGTFHVGVTGTNGSLSHSVTVTYIVQDISITANPTNVVVDAGSPGASNITVTGENGFTGIVDLTTNSTSCTINPTTVTGSGSATLSCTFTTASTVHVGVTATSGSLSHSSTVTYTVQDFTITASPTPVTVLASSAGTSTITLAPLNGFNGIVSLTSNSTFCTLSPTSVTGSGSSTLSCTFTSTGTFHVGVNGTSASLSHAVTVAYIVQDFTIAANPTTVVVNAGSAGNSTIIVTGLNGFAGTVTLSTNSTSCTISPTSVTISGNATLSCTFNSSSPAHVVITGTSGARSHTVIVTFTPQDFTISASPTTVTANAGIVATSNVTVTGLDGFAGVVSLTTNSPACTVSPASVTGSGNAGLSCTFTQAMTVHVKVSGASASLSHATTVTIVVQDFTISATPPAPANAGSSSSSTITVSALNQFAGTVTLSDTLLAGLSCGPITPATLIGSGTATVSCTATSAGNYTLTITGTSTNLVHATNTTFTVQDYTITASSPAEGNVHTSISSTITVTFLNGFSGTVSLTDTQPSGLDCAAITPSSLTSSGMATISCSSMTAGNYTLTITGNSTTLSHTTSSLFMFGDFTINATSPGAVDVSQASPATISLTSLNHFAGTVSLTDTVPMGLSCGPIEPMSLTGSGTATFSCSGSTAGDYSVLIRGAAGSLMRSSTLTVQVTDFSIASTPTLLTSSIGTNATSTITVTSLNGYYGIVNVTASIQSEVTPGGSGGLGGGRALVMAPPASQPDPIMNPGSLAITSGGTGQYTLTIILPTGTLAANYTIIVTSTDGILLHSTQLTLQVTDFSLSIPTSIVTMSPGGNSSMTLNLQGLNGFQASLTFSTNISPPGPAASVNPSSLYPTYNSSAVLTITVPPNLPFGNYTLTVQAGIGTLSHTVQITIMVQSGSTSVLTRILNSNTTATTGIAGLIAVVSLFSIHTVRGQNNFERRRKRQSFPKRVSFRGQTRSADASRPFLVGPFGTLQRLSD